MSSEENKNPLNQFCSGATSSRYDEFAGETLVNATVVANITPTSRSPAMMIPRIGRELMVELSGILLAFKSYSIGRQVVVRNNENSVGEIRLYNIFGPFVDYIIIKTFDAQITTRPLIVDTYNSCVVSIDGVGYTISESFTVTKIIGDGWADPSSLAFIDGYTLLSVKNSRQFLRSELNGTAFTDLINFSATQSEDNIKNIANINNQLFIFCDRHMEIWWNSGATADQPFTRQDGLGSQYGTISFNTLVVDGVGYNALRSETMRGIFSWSPQVQKISVDAVDSDMEKGTDIIIHSSVENGRRYIHVLIDDSILWSYDIASTSWHQRTNQIPVDYMPDGDSYYFIDSRGIHVISGTTDNGEVITCERRSPHILSSGKRVFHTLLELDAGGNPGILKLEYSNDGGRTWYNSGFSTNSTLGRYNRYRFNRLGSAIDRVYKLQWSDVEIYSAYLLITEGIR